MSIVFKKEILWGLQSGWLLKAKKKKKDFLFDMYEGSNWDPHQTFSFIDHAPRHRATCAQLPMQ